MSRADSYIHESIPLDEFAAASIWMDEARDAGPEITLHILIEDDWGHRNPEGLQSYLPCDEPDVVIADDGWVLRVFSSGFEPVNSRDLMAMVIRVQAVARRRNCGTALAPTASLEHPAGAR